MGLEEVKAQGASLFNVKDWAGAQVRLVCLYVLACVCTNVCVFLYSSGQPKEGAHRTALAAVCVRVCVSMCVCLYCSGPP